MGLKAEFTDERKTWVCMKARVTTEITVLVKIYCVKYDDERFAVILVSITRSTAQGGGESFKNRKPIGELGCCESRMAERIR